LLKLDLKIIQVTSCGKVLRQSAERGGNYKLTKKNKKHDQT